MKTLIISLSIISIILMACNKNSPTDITGVYVNQAQSNYSVAFDTLTINLITDTKNTYRVESQTGYQKIKDEKLMTKQFKHRMFEAVYDPTKKILSEGDLGIQITYLAEKKSLLIKGSEYKKIQ
jgi:uncharacterized protein YcfL